MDQQSVLRYRSAEVPRQEGEFARLRVLKGPDLGSVFVIRSSTLTIGRGDGATLVLRDIQASRVHAKLEFTKAGWKVTDLGSANGIFYRGEYLRDFVLKSGDHFTVGGSILEFLMNHEDSRVLAAPIVEDPEIEKREIAFAQQKVRVQNLSRGVKVKPKGGKKKANPLLLVAGALAAGAYLYPEVARPLLHDYGLDFISDLLPEVPVAKKTSTAVKTKEEKKAQADAERNLANYLPPEGSTEITKTAEQYYRQGFREYRVGNYLRAKESFELALQVNPAHERSRYYLASSVKENENEIRRLINAGKKSKDVGRLKEAQGYFETAMRHMASDQTNPDYIECEEALKGIKAGSGL